MTTQLGNWTFGSPNVNHDWIHAAKAKFLRDAPECASEFSRDGFAVVYRSSEPITLEPREKRSSASLVVWDGRLDNRSELLDELRGLHAQSSDAEIAAAAYERWQTAAFRRLLGDWAIAAWDSHDHALVLAKDFIGTRPLFYQLTPNGVKWSSALEWLVEDERSPLDLNLEYAAGWLSFFPAADLTPYRSIHSVPASHFVRFEVGKATLHKYWDFSPDTEARCASDGEYDDRFRALLAQSVQRRLRGQGPILAELSGGMDSSAVVCMADGLESNGTRDTRQLDTISYFDDSEPNWNERPYFAKVEEKRGRTGFHVALDTGEDLDTVFALNERVATPAECAKQSRRNRKIKELVDSKGYVAVLSGTGGDEFTGGVPTPKPELADLLATASVPALSRQLIAWAISQRRPWTHVLFDAVSIFLPPLWTNASETRHAPPWLTPEFVSRHREALNGYARRVHLFGPRPSFQENLSTLDVVRRQLACSHSTSRSTLEKRYPYLDRDLLEFLFAVPRRQLVQPGRRRAMMRRALAGIVPDEILNRKRKAYVVRASRAAIASRWNVVSRLGRDMAAESLGIISSKAFERALQEVRTASDVPVQAVLRALVLEHWLRNWTSHGSCDFGQGGHADEIAATKPSVTSSASVHSTFS
jgi:asparagine synthase (glutamine-hydrolysing)